MAAMPLLARPTAAVITAVLQHADTVEDLGGGKRLYRLSAKRSRTRPLREQLGKQAFRAAEVAVIWDEREDQIVRVLEQPAVKPRAFDEEAAWWSARGGLLAA
jgi:hypothetical protein